MSFLFFRPYLSVADNNRCPISIYSRFFIALFVLGIGLTASVIIKGLSPNHAAPPPLNFGEAPAPVKGSLESFPRDFEIQSTDPVGMNSTPSRHGEYNSQQIRHMVGKNTAELSACSMDKKFPGSVTISDGDDRPSLPLNNNPVPSEDDSLKNGYIRHLTSNGDCLKNLAKKYLHDEDRWEEIYRLNKEVLTNKNVVPIGIILFIPPK